MVRKNTKTFETMKIAFSLWEKDFRTSPADFSPLQDDRSPEEIGEQCAVYFSKLLSKAKKIQAQEEPPQNIIKNNQEGF